MMIAELILSVIFQTITQIGTGTMSTSRNPGPSVSPSPSYR